MNVMSDPVEDRPFPPGVVMTDFAGIAWKDLTPERTRFVAEAHFVRGSSLRHFLREKLLSIVPMQGKSVPGFKDQKAATSFRNALYDVGATLWGEKDARGRLVSNMRTLIVKENNGTWSVEFVRLK